MKRKFYISFVSTFALMAFYSVKESPFVYPEYFPEPTYNLSSNPLDSVKIELGKVLFYDPVLSKDNTISCASCHSPFNAFSHTDHDLSHGIHDQIGTRNAPALFNLAWQHIFMWDGAVNHLDFQPLAPISHPKEMGENIKSIVEKLNASARYKNMLLKAFGDSMATGERMLKALSQFQLTLISANSKYDKVKQGKAVFTEQENKGYLLFQKNCNTCHTEPLFTNYGFANNGLPVDTTLNDFGRWGITKHSKDSLLFKVPSLRNLSYTHPYMHDGRFKKLHQVLGHYTDGISQSATLSDELKTSIKLNSNEKTDLIAFLLTLNDSEFVFNASHRIIEKK
jgi:cytochrome c peroxidase